MIFHLQTWEAAVIALTCPARVWGPAVLGTAVLLQGSAWAQSGLPLSQSHWPNQTAIGPQGTPPSQSVFYASYPYVAPPGHPIQGPAQDVVTSDDLLKRLEHAEQQIRELEAASAAADLSGAKKELETKS